MASMMSLIFSSINALGDTVWSKSRYSILSKWSLLISDKSSFTHDLKVHLKGSFITHMGSTEFGKVILESCFNRVPPAMWKFLDLIGYSCRYYQFIGGGVNR